MRMPGIAGMAEDKLIDVHKVLNVELSIDDKTVYKAGSIASLAGAAVGGVTFGGAGAIVGSLTSARKNTGKISNLSIKLRINDTNNPLLEINFIDKPTKSSNEDVIKKMKVAEKWTNLIEVMRHRIAESKSTPQKTNDDNSQDINAKLQLSIEERLSKLNDLKNRSLLTSEEYDKKRAEILSEL